MITNGMFGIFGALLYITNPKRSNALFSSSMLNSLWKFTITQPKLNYVTKKGIEYSPEQRRQESSNVPPYTSLSQNPTTANNLFKTNITQTLLLPGSPLYLKHLFARFPPTLALQRPISAPNSSMAQSTPSVKATDDKEKELQNKTNSIDEPSSAPLKTVDTTAVEVTSIELNKAQEVKQAQQQINNDNPLAEEAKQEKPEQKVNQEQKKINSKEQDKTGSENDDNPTEGVIEIELNDEKDNPLEDLAPSNEQVDEVIKELSQDQIAEIVEEAKVQELAVLKELTDFYSSLKEELKNPPQTLDGAHKKKRESIVKNIDNILKDIEKSQKNISLGISMNRHKSLVTENPLNRQKELDKINTQKQSRSDKASQFYQKNNLILNYNEKELNQIDQFIKNSGKDLKRVANTRNDDIRRKFFSSFIDHTISFAKYNINWAPAAYNLTWAVVDYVIMGIVVDTIKQGANSISTSYTIGTTISNWIKGAPGENDKELTANLFTRSIATLSGIIGGWAAMTIMTPITLAFKGTGNVLYAPVGIYKNYQSYKKDQTGNIKNWAKSTATLKSERTTRKNAKHTTKEQKKFAEIVQSQKTYESKKR